MANLFTAVSAEQQEIVAGGRFTLNDLIETSYSQRILAFSADVSSTGEGGSVDQNFGAADTNTTATKDLDVVELPGGGNNDNVPGISIL